MQFGQRTQNASSDWIANKTANTSQRSRKPSGPRGGVGLDLQDQAPPSAARLAAEAAFAGPASRVIQNVQTQITLRRARSIVRAEQPAEVSTAVAEQPAAKGSRVFRIDSARGHASVPTEQAPQARPDQKTDTPPLLPKTRRRRAPEQRPGPVVLVVQKPATPRPLFATAAVPPAPTSKTLAARLDQVTPVLAAIEKAQSFHFVDSRFENQYQRLSDQADLLLNQLKGHRR